MTKIFFLFLPWSFAAGLLQGGDVSCPSEGHSVKVPGITDTNSCITCICQNNVVRCVDESKDCPSLKGCYNVEFTGNKCCPYRCKNCSSLLSKSLEISNCVIRQCFSGILTTSSLSCPKKVNCENPLISDAHCCPSCEGCFKNGLSLREGETKEFERDCQVCSCHNGSLSCAIKPCPVLSCPIRLQVRRSDQCCSECSRRQDDTSFGVAERKICFFQGKAHLLGSSFKDSNCKTTTCKCLNDGVSCLQHSCPELPCSQETQLFVPGKCCPECISKYGVSKISAPLSPKLTCTTSIVVSNTNVTYSEGESWEMRIGVSQSCHSCTCNQGVTSCSLKNCPKINCLAHQTSFSEGSCCPICTAKEGICTVFGDPHYKTFDGRIFNFQGSCKYLLAKDCRAKGGNSSFSIRITNDARDSLAFSWTRTITVHSGGMKVSLLQKMRVKINGKKVDLPYIKLGTLSVMKDGYRVILRTHEGVRILWDGVSFLEVSMPSKFSNRLCGLCGNFNGDSRDDFNTRSGRRLKDGQAFGDSWRIGGLGSCSILPRDMPTAYEPSCSLGWEAKIQSDRNCNAFQSSLFDKCHEKVNPNYHYNACKLDMCECPSDQCHCEVLSAYARECERAGILIYNWREDTDCKNVTSFSYIHSEYNEVESRTGIDNYKALSGKSKANSQNNNNNNKQKKKTKQGDKMNKEASKERKRKERGYTRRRDRRNRKKHRDKENNDRDGDSSSSSSLGLVLKKIKKGSSVHRVISWKKTLNESSRNSRKMKPPFERLLKESGVNDPKSDSDFESDPNSDFETQALILQKGKGVFFPFENKNRTPLPLLHEDILTTNDNNERTQRFLHHPSRRKTLNI